METECGSSPVLQVVAKDSNVLLVAQAAQCLTGLARGLRKNFLTYATNVSTALPKSWVTVWSLSVYKCEYGVVCSHEHKCSMFMISVSECEI